MQIGTHGHGIPTTPGYYWLKGFERPFFWNEYVFGEESEWQYIGESPWK